MAWASPPRRRRSTSSDSSQTKRKRKSKSRGSTSDGSAQSDFTDSAQRRAARRSSGRSAARRAEAARRRSPRPEQDREAADLVPVAVPPGYPPLPGGRWPLWWCRGALPPIGWSPVVMDLLRFEGRGPPPAHHPPPPPQPAPAHHPPPPPQPAAKHPPAPCTKSAPPVPPAAQLRHPPAPAPPQQTYTPAAAAQPHYATAPAPQPQYSSPLTPAQPYSAPPAAQPHHPPPPAEAAQPHHPPPPAEAAQPHYVPAAAQHQYSSAPAQPRYAPAAAQPHFASAPAAAAAAADESPARQQRGGGRAAPTPAPLSSAVDVSAVTETHNRSADLSVLHLSSSVCSAGPPEKQQPPPPAITTPATPQTANAPKVGDVCEAYFNGTWYPAKIAAVNAAEQTCEVHWLGEETVTEGMPYAEIRPAQQRQQHGGVPARPSQPTPGGMAPPPRHASVPAAVAQLAASLQPERAVLCVALLAARVERNADRRKTDDMPYSGSQRTPQRLAGDAMRAAIGAAARGDSARLATLTRAQASSCLTAVVRHYNTVGPVRPHLPRFIDVLSPEPTRRRMRDTGLDDVTLELMDVVCDHLHAVSTLWDGLAGARAAAAVAEALSAGTEHSPAVAAALTTLAADQSYKHPTNYRTGAAALEAADSGSDSTGGGSPAMSHTSSFGGALSSIGGEMGLMGRGARPSPSGRRGGSGLSVVSGVPGLARPKQRGRQASKRGEELMRSPSSASGSQQLGQGGGMRRAMQRATSDFDDDFDF